MSEITLCLALALKWQAPIASNLLGAWKGYIVEGGVVSPADTARYMKWNLDLSADNTFKWHQENHIMVDMVYDGKGTYTVEGNTIHVLGKATGYADDGYKKDKDLIDLDFKLVKRDNQLYLTMGSITGHPEDALTVLFARPDATPTLPEDVKRKRWVPKKSDPEAVALARRVEARYASLQSYSETGAESSNGEGFQPEAAASTILYQKPDKLYYKSVSPSSLKNARTYVTIVKGSIAWYSEGGSPFGKFDSPRQLLGSVSLSYGIEADLIPSLLMPSLAGLPHPLSGVTQILTKQPVVFQGKHCAVVEFTDNPRNVMRLTIDLSTLMILKIETDDAKESVVIHPLANPAIPASGFKVPS